MRIRGIFLYLLLSFASVSFGQYGTVAVTRTQKPSNIDVDVSDYASRIASASGALQTGDLEKINTFVKTLKSNSIWTKLKDVGIFMGGFNGCFVKLKYADPLYTTLINTAFISGDYSETTALTSTTASTKKVDTQIIPANYSLSKNNISLGYFSLSGVASDVSYAMLDNRVSGAFGFDLQKATIYMNASPVKAFDVAVQKIGEPRFMYFSSNGFINWGIDNVSIYPQPAAVAVNDLVFDTSISLWGGRNGGSNVFGSGRYSFYWIGDYLTYAEIKILYRAVLDLNKSIGRVQDKPQAIFFGDSITKGEGSSAFTNRWTYIAASYFGLQEANLGLSGSRYRVSDAAINGGYPRRSEINNYNILVPGTKIFIQYGVNDLNQDVTANGDPTILSDFSTKLSSHIDEILALGVTANDIYVGSPSFTNNGASATKQGAYAAMVLAVADAKNCWYMPMYETMRDNGGATLLNDVLHPNNSGHYLMARTAFFNSYKP